MWAARHSAEALFSYCRVALTSLSDAAAATTSTTTTTTLPSPDDQCAGVKVSKHVLEETADCETEFWNISIFPT